MAKCRIGHFVEARILEVLEVDFIDESEVLTPADEEHHIDKHAFRAPFVCGCRDLGEALRRVSDGAAMLRTKGEAGTGNIVEGVRHLRALAGAVFVGSGIFLAENPAQRARAVVAAVTHWQDAARLAEVSTGLGVAMRGIELGQLTSGERMATRGW